MKRDLSDKSTSYLGLLFWKHFITENLDNYLWTVERSSKITELYESTWEAL